ncbi:MAG: hypothetical protein R3E60_02505 [Alphaproteobacteria bacterium]
MGMVVLALISRPPKHEKQEKNRIRLVILIGRETFVKNKRKFVLKTQSFLLEFSYKVFNPPFCTFWAISATMPRMSEILEILADGWIQGGR